MTTHLDEYGDPFDVVADIADQAESDAGDDQAWTIFGLLRVASMAAYLASELGIRHGISSPDARTLTDDVLRHARAVPVLAEADG